VCTLRRLSDTPVSEIAFLMKFAVILVLPLVCIKLPMSLVSEDLQSYGPHLKKEVLLFADTPVVSLHLLGRGRISDGPRNYLVGIIRFQSGVGGFRRITDRTTLMKMMTIIFLSPVLVALLGVKTFL
jgi:hypothetical protein